jgi:hypothetical protein
MAVRFAEKLLTSGNAAHLDASINSGTGRVPFLEAEPYLNRRNECSSLSTPPENRVKPQPCSKLRNPHKALINPLADTWQLSFAQSDKIETEEKLKNPAPEPGFALEPVNRIASIESVTPLS